MSNNNHKNSIIPFPEPSSVNQEVPWSDDAFDREAVSARLTDTVTRIGQEGCKCGLVIVSGDYGVGKSFFLRRWAVEWKKQMQGIAIEHNMWECEDDDDPLVGLVCSLLEAVRIASKRKLPDNELSCIKSAVSKYSQPTLAASLVAAQSLITKFSGVDPQEIMNVWKKEYDPMSRWQAKREARDAIRTLLSKLVAKSQGSPLVIIIDELDRCRPIFAVETLKRLNHVLNIPGVVFVAGVNMNALEASVRSVYGDNAPQEYLLPMYTARLNLRPLSFRPFDIPKGDAGASKEKMEEYIKVKMKQHALPASQSFVQSLRHVFAGLVHGPHPITPRQVDIIFRWVSLALLNVGQIILEPFMLVSLTAMRVIRPDDYMKVATAPENFAIALDALDALFPDDMPEGSQYGVTPKWKIMAYFALASREGSPGSPAENSLFNLLCLHSDGKLQGQRQSLLPKCLSGEESKSAVKHILSHVDRVSKNTMIEGYEVRYGTMLTIISAFDLRPER